MACRTSKALVVGGKGEPNTTVTGERILRGRLKRTRVNEDFIAVGDYVQISMLPEGTGMIEAVEERGLTLDRLAPTPRGEYRQIFVANVEQVVFVFALADPPPSLRMLDRFLVIAEKQEIPPLIIANKTDLVDIEDAEKTFSIYSDIGYHVIFTSAESQDGVDELRECLKGQFSNPWKRGTQLNM